MSEFDDILGASVDLRSEKAILNDVLTCVSAIPESLIWRNNTGQAWAGRRLRLRVGQSVRLEPGMVVLAQARPIKFGLEGSADIIGPINRVPIAIEVKDETGKQSDQQVIFEHNWVRAGGVYILARSVDEAEHKVNEAIAWRKPEMSS